MAWPRDTPHQDMLRYRCGVRGCPSGSRWAPYDEILWHATNDHSAPLGISLRDCDWDCVFCLSPLCAGRRMCNDRDIISHLGESHGITIEKWDMLRPAYAPPPPQRAHEGTEGNLTGAVGAVAYATPQQQEGNQAAGGLEEYDQQPSPSMGPTGPMG